MQIRPLSLHAPLFSSLALLTSLTLMAGCDSGSGGVPPYTAVSRDEAPAWSPDGSRVAYFHVETLPDQAGAYPTGLYVLDLETGARRLVVEGNASNPDWSPDGMWLAFDAGDVFVVRLDGSELRRVTDFGSAFFPSWDPDGSRIAFDVTANGPRVPVDSSGIWLISLEGEDRRHLGLGRNPDWSPEGSQLAYEGPPGMTESEGQIWITDTEVGFQVQLTETHSLINRAPTWSPDGSWIVWHTDTGVRLMRADGSEQRLLAAGGTTPAWAPDGERLVFSAPSPDGSRIVLWTIRRDGTDRRLLSP